MSTRKGAAPPLEPHDLRQLHQLFHDHAGLEFPQDTEFVLERRLQERVLALNLPGFGDYVRLLRSPEGRAELDAALDEITTHETYFFREEFQLNAFREELLPRLRLMTDQRRRITLWSAGCSSGEEAYTLAMILDDSKLFEGWTSRIVGTDLSRRCIASARKATYGKASFRAVPREFLGHYFTEEEGKMKVSNEIRERCIFLQANLLDHERHITLGKFEAIFCRNVLIYLSESARQRVLRLLYDRLQPGGYLMLGHSESLLNDAGSFEIVHLQNDVVYRRPEYGDARSEKIR